MLHKRGLRTLAVYSVPLPPASPHEMDPATAPPRVIELPVPYPPLPNLDELLFLTGLSSRSYHADHICAPAYGVFAVTCVDLGNRKQSSSVVHFWLSGRINGGTLDDVGPSCVYGHPHLIEQMAVGSSGAYVVVLARAGEDAVPYLGLVHCRASGPLSPQITFRKLDVGDASLQDCHQLAFDDSLGLVLIAGSLGRLTAISYV
ncbi:hypothetical protein C8R46DRAFT_366969 [Mycena filopes]|nr:hypothetical protein C8R46DRAFT_366969 [Mycena filopes]